MKWKCPVLESDTEFATFVEHNSASQGFPLLIRVIKIQTKSSCFKVEMMCKTGQDRRSQSINNWHISV